MIDKPVMLSEHAIEQMSFRGTSKEEIIDVIRTCSWQPAELGRLECRKNFPYNQNWNDKHYPTKQVRPIFAEEKDKIIIITVYVYYF